MPNCCAYGCCNRTEKGFKLYRFPANPERKKIWINKVSRLDWEPSSTSYLCQEHFEHDQFENKRADGKRMLKWNAVPTIFSQHCNIPKKSARVKNYCCVPYCSSDSSNNKGPFLHDFPRDPALAREWISAIPRDVGSLFRINKLTKVCSLHFEAADYCPTTEPHMPSLLCGSAVPSLFNCTKQKSVHRKLSRPGVTDFIPKTTEVKAASRNNDRLRSDSEPKNHSGNQRESDIEHTIDNSDNKYFSPEHTCCICGKSFKRKHNLTKHLRFHTDKASKCKECGKDFDKRHHWRNVIVHMRTHTGQKRRYKCQYCGMFFTSRSSLNQHTRKKCKCVKSDSTKDIDPDPGKSARSNEYDIGFVEKFVKTEDDDLTNKVDPIAVYIKTEEEDFTIKEESTEEGNIKEELIEERNIKAEPIDVL